jgi:cytoskeleton protein RodZ
MSDFGGKLRLARERRGVSLRQIAASTKISAASLEALERNDISKLPGGIFSRAFVRSYAAEVGLDPDETVQEFLRLFQGEPGHATPPPSAIPESETRFESQQRVAALVVKAVLIGVPVVAAILYVTLRGPLAGWRHSGAPASVEQPVLASPPSQPAEEPGLAQPVATEVVPLDPGAVPPMAVEIHPTDECWVKVTVDGRVALARTMKAGEKDVVKARDRMLIEVGDAGAFAFSIDGRPGKPLGARGEVSATTITKDTVSSYLQ